jgi:hypothetical protein
MSSVPSSRRAGRINGTGSTRHAQPSRVVGQAEQQRLRRVERADHPAHHGVGGGRVRTFHHDHRRDRLLHLHQF